MESAQLATPSEPVTEQLDIPPETPHAHLILEGSEEMLANGGSCLAGPDGNWVIEPAVEKEILLVAVVEHQRVRRERQNFDPAGHYSRPDVTRLEINRSRQSTITIVDEVPGGKP